MPNSPTAPAVDHPLLAQFRGALAEQRARRAWGLAKELFKALPEAQWPKDELRRAFALRLQSLLDEGVPREAALMHDQVLANRPWLVECLPLPLRLSLSRAGAKIAPGAVAATDDAELQRCLRQEVTDLRAVAQGAGLPADSPWRAEAGLLLDAWDVLEGGGRLPSLQAIGRRSPLVGWRLFLQALDAFYQRDDAQLAANVERLAADSPLRPVAAQLLALAQGAPPAESGWPAELAAKLGAGASLAARLAQVERLFNDNQKKAAFLQLDAIARELAAAGQACVALDLLAVLADRMDDPDVFFRLSPFASTHEPLILLRYFRDSDMFAGEAADIWRHPAFACTLSNLDEAVLTASIAQALPRGENSMFAAMARAFNLPAANDDPDLPSADTLYTRSLDALPLASTFRAYADWLDEHRPADVPPLLEQWGQQFPDDPEPVRRQLAGRLWAGDAGELFTVFSRLRELLGAGNPEIRNLHVWVAARYLACGSGAAADRALAQQWLAAGTAPRDQALRLAVGYLAEPVAQRPPLVEALVALQRPRLLCTLFRILTGERRTAVPEALTAQVQDGVCWAADLRETVELFDWLGHPEHAECQAACAAPPPVAVPPQERLALLHTLMLGTALEDEPGTARFSLIHTLTHQLLADASMNAELPLLLSVCAWLWRQRLDIQSRERVAARYGRHAMRLLAAARQLQAEFPLSAQAQKGMARLQRRPEFAAASQAEPQGQEASVAFAWAVAICEVRNSGKATPPAESDIQRALAEVQAGPIVFPPVPKPPRQRKTPVRSPKRKAAPAPPAGTPPSQPTLF